MRAQGFEQPVDAVARQSENGVYPPADQTLDEQVGNRRMRASNYWLTVFR